jgi:hypothetical protein
MNSPADILRDCIESCLREVHTAMPGIVVSYDASTNKAKIQPALNKRYIVDPKPLPALEDVPVMFMGGSSFNVTFPVKAGDYVLLIFMERSIDLWKSVGGQITPDDRRMFHLSDAIAIPGLQPFSGNFSNNNGSDLVINFGGSEFRIKENGDVQIKTASKIAIGDATTEVLDVISKILSIIKKTTGVTATGTATNGALSYPVTTSGGFQVDVGTLIDLENKINNLKTDIT